ncbi:DUF1800 family protein [Dactylosporangium sp. NPDC051541]|uniref:DUF1800 family protein n=1 Tax=Dactylosporangium sp. NPDC051541 TaxID=3363977 RepID=UPI0037ABD6B5
MVADVALMLRRSGFGPTAEELTAARSAGYAATLDALTAPVAPDVGASNSPVPDIGVDPLVGLANPTPAQRTAAETKRGEQLAAITRWWLDRLTTADHQTMEKLVFFWHGHWATSVKKVIRPQLMLLQHLTLRSSLNFGAMAHAMVHDPALVFWLDGQANTRTAPNENLGRELLELFTCGIGTYTEQDVKEAGRALTGWRIDFDKARTFFAPQSADPGMKTILGVTKAFDATALVDLVLTNPQCPRFIAARLWYRYASPTTPVPAAAQQAMVDAFPDSMKMLRALLASDDFQQTAGNLVKQPVEWFVGAMRQLQLRPAALDTAALGQVLYHLDRLGQVPFAPPSVGGWPAGAAWLTPGTAQTRLSLAARIAGMADVRRLDPTSLAYLLAVDTWSDRTYAALKKATDPRRLLMLGLISPEYVVT